MNASNFDRLCAAMKEARGRMTDRTPEQVDDDIHRERLANLEPPELGESLQDYCVRMIHVHGTTYAEAAVERHQGATPRERARLSVKDAERELRRFMLPRRRGRPTAT